MTNYSGPKRKISRDTDGKKSPTTSSSQYPHFWTQRVVLLSHLIYPVCFFFWWNKCKCLQPSVPSPLVSDLLSEGHVSLQLHLHRRTIKMDKVKLEVKRKQVSERMLLYQNTQDRMSAGWALMGSVSPLKDGGECYLSNNRRIYNLFSRHNFPSLVFWACFRAEVADL